MPKFLKCACRTRAHRDTARKDKPVLGTLHTFGRIQKDGQGGEAEGREKEEAFAYFEMSR